MSGLLVASLLLVPGYIEARWARDTAGTAISVEGESPSQTDMRAVTDRRASGGAYLAVDAPGDGRRSATYMVRIAGEGTYRMEAVLTPPATPDRQGGSYFGISVNGGRFVQVATSEPHWGTASGAWGPMVRIRLDDVALRSGSNSITFLADEGFALDTFTLSATGRD